MRQLSPRRLTAALLAPVMLALAPAGCSRKAETEVELGPPVRGKVTYRGEPVPYGVVLFYSLGQIQKSSAGSVRPAATAAIGPDGTYEMNRAPLGPVLVAVATDPEVSRPLLMKPGMGGVGPGGGP